MPEWNPLRLVPLARECLCLHLPGSGTPSTFPRAAIPSWRARSSTFHQERLRYSTTTGLDRTHPTQHCSSGGRGPRIA